MTEISNHCTNNTTLRAIILHNTLSNKSIKAYIPVWGNGKKPAISGVQDVCFLCLPHTHLDTRQFITGTRVPFPSMSISAIFMSQ